MAHLIHNVLPVPLRKIEVIDPETSVKHCVHLMCDRDIGALVVIDKSNQLQGIVSERDIVRSYLNKGLNLETAKAADIVYKEVTILSPHDPIEKAMQAITDTKRRHILISDNNQLIAILSIGDLLFNLLEDKARVIEQLENYIHTY